MPYRSGRGTDWVKVKCSQEQEFVVGGYTESDARHMAFASLILAVNDKGGLRYAGHVGTGFTRRKAHWITRHRGAGGFHGVHRRWHGSPS